MVTLVESLDSLNELETAGGLDYLSELASGSRGTANIKAYSEIIRERSILRKLISVANKIAESGYSPSGRKAYEVLDEAEREVFNISDERPQEGGPIPINPLLEKALDRIDELAGSDGNLTGLGSGYKDLESIR